MATRLLTLALALALTLTLSLTLTLMLALLQLPNASPLAGAAAQDPCARWTSSKKACYARARSLGDKCRWLTNNGNCHGANGCHAPDKRACPGFRCVNACLNYAHSCWWDGRKCRPLEDDSRIPSSSSTTITPTAGPTTTPSKSPTRAPVFCDIAPVSTAACTQSRDKCYNTPFVVCGAPDAQNRLWVSSRGLVVQGLAGFYAIGIVCRSLGYGRANAALICGTLGRVCSCPASNSSPLNTCGKAPQPAIHSVSSSWQACPGAPECGRVRRTGNTVMWPCEKDP